MKRLVREKPLGAVGALIFLGFLLVGIFADVLAPHGMTEQNLPRRLEGPSAEFPLGTDQYGRDQLSRIIYGARISMIVAVAACGINVLISMTFGLASGYWAGTFDLIIQRVVDAWLTFPPLLVILTAMVILKAGIVSMVVVLGCFYGIANIRTVRGVVISVKESTYVEAARTVGCRTPRILFRHILPQILAPVVTVMTMNIGSLILDEATISFLGFGIPPPQPSWGGMLSIEGRNYMQQAPLLALWPGLCIAIVVYGINMFGDALRDLLDPRLRGAPGRYGRVKGKK